MRPGMVGGTALLALLLLAAPALAATGDLHGHAALPIQADGTREVTAPDARVLVAGDAGRVSLLLQGDAGKATRVIQRAYGVVSAAAQAEILWSQRVETQELDLAGALVTIEARKPGFQAFADGGRATIANGATPSLLEVGVLREAVRVTEDLTAPLSVEVVGQVRPFDERIPAGLYQAAADSGHVALDGGFRLFLSGAAVGWQAADGAREQFKAYFHQETRPGALYNPADNTWFGHGSHTEYVQEYLVVEAEAAHADLHFSGLAGALFSGQPRLDVEGTAVLPRMQGTVTIREEEATTTHRLDGQDLTLAGRFTLRPHHADATGTRVEGSGDFTTVSYGAVQARYDWAGAAVAVGLGAVLLAALAWGVGHGKALLGSLGGGAIAGYARVHGQEVLEHPGRAEVYERVKAFPGVNFVQLSQAVGFGASTLNYHLRVLEKNGYITSVRDGRYLRFFDRTSGTYAGARKMAVSALRNEASAAMAKHIRDHPGVAQCDLAAAFGVTPSTVTWHINRLAGQGLVQKEREGAHTRYYVGQAWASLPLDEQNRQGGFGDGPARHRAPEDEPAAAPAPVAVLA